MNREYKTLAKHPRNRELIELACSHILRLWPAGHSGYHEVIKWVPRDPTNLVGMTEAQRHRLFECGILSGRSYLPGTREAGIPRLGEYLRELEHTIKRFWPQADARPNVCNEVLTMGGVDPYDA